MFLRGVESQLTFAAGPLYAVLHEACCAQGFATKWSAQRARPEFPAFDPAVALGGDAPLWISWPKWPAGPGLAGRPGA